MLALPAPIGPAAGEAVEHLLGAELADIALVLGEEGQRLGVGHRAPQAGRDGLFLDLLQARGDAGLAEILLGQHVGGDLRPARSALRHFRSRNTIEPSGLRISDVVSPKSIPRRVTGRKWCCAVRSAWSCPVLSLTGPPLFAACRMLFQCAIPREGLDGQLRRFHRKF